MRVQGRVLRLFANGWECGGALNGKARGYRSGLGHGCLSEAGTSVRGGKDVYCTIGEGGRGEAHLRDASKAI
jgi:hypothetical protein